MLELNWLGTSTHWFPVCIGKQILCRHPLGWCERQALLLSRHQWNPRGQFYRNACSLLHRLAWRLCLKSEKKSGKIQMFQVALFWVLSSRKCSEWLLSFCKVVAQVPLMSLGKRPYVRRRRSGKQQGTRENALNHSCCRKNVQFCIMKGQIVKTLKKFSQMYKMCTIFVQCIRCLLFWCN